MLKLKKVIDGKEVEIEITPEEAKQAGLLTQTELLSNDELFKEAMEMRGVKTGGNASGNAEIAELKAQIKALLEQQKALSSALAEEQKARKETVERLQAEAEKKRKAEINSLIENAIKEGKITPEQKDKWQERLESAYEATVEIINELPPNPAIANKGNGAKGDKRTQTPQQQSDSPLNASIPQVADLIRAEMQSMN